MIDREAVRANAKYLRQVRPIDPDEIAEYIEGHPHPGVVKQTLREEAFSLGLVERPDGSFVPVADEPVEHRSWEPTVFPTQYGQLLEAELQDRYGQEWYCGDSGNSLREAIRELKADYLAQAEIEYDELTAAGYAIYHLPAYYAAVGYVLATLTKRGLLPRSLRVLDVGAGAGGPALGLHDFLFGQPTDARRATEPPADETEASGSRDEMAASVEYHAVEPSAAADILRPMLGATTRNFRPTIHQTTIEEFGYDVGHSGDAKFDLILFGNVLNELAAPESVVERAVDQLTPSGTIIALEPADRNTATELRAVERAVTANDRVTVYGPTLRLWPDEQPADQGWSFDVRPDVATPDFQSKLAGAAGSDNDPAAYRNTDVQFAYSVLRVDGERRYPFQANRQRHAKMAEMDDHVTERINLLAVKLSHDLSDGDNALFKVGDGSQQTDHYAVVTAESGLNSALSRAAYGAVVAFENVLVLWNDDEAAYNLVVDGETVVDCLSGR